MGVGNLRPSCKVMLQDGDIYGLLAKGKIPTFIDYLGIVVELLLVGLHIYTDFLKKPTL